MTDSPSSSAPARSPGVVLWLTGLSGAGKSTLAQGLHARLRAADRAATILDGDAIRHDLWPELGFSKTDRDQNVARLARVAILVAGHGVFVIVAAIAPYADARRAARAQAEGNGLSFLEVFVSAPLDVLVARDVKGLYRRALTGELAHFTGVSDPYEPPSRPDLILHTQSESIRHSVDRLWDLLCARDLVDAGANGAAAAARARLA